MLYWQPTEANTSAAPSNRNTWYRVSADVIIMSDRVKLSYEEVPPWRHVELFFDGDILTTQAANGTDRMTAVS